MTLRMCAEAETSPRSDFPTMSLVVSVREGGTSETSVDSGGARSESVWSPGLSSREGRCEVKKQPLIYVHVLSGVSIGTLSGYVFVIQRVMGVIQTSQHALFPQNGPVFCIVCVLSVKRRHTSASVTGHRGHECCCINITVLLCHSSLKGCQFNPS